MCQVVGPATMSACQSDGTPLASRCVKGLLHGLRVHTGSSVLYFNVCSRSVFQITHIIYAYHTYRPSEYNSDGIFKLHSDLLFEYTV